MLSSLFGGSKASAEGSGTKGEQVVSADVASRHWSTKIHSYRGKYSRVWCVTPSVVHHVDPDTMKVTNTWAWTDVVEFVPAAASTTDFSFTVREPGGKKTEVLKFVAEQRAPLLCDLARYATGGDKDPQAKRFVAVKLTRGSARAECVLELGSWYVAVLTQDGRRISLYPFKEVTAIRPLKEDASAVTLYLHGRSRLFALPERSEFLRGLSVALTRLGIPALLALGLHFCQ